MIAPNMRRRLRWLAPRLAIPALLLSAVLAGGFVYLRFTGDRDLELALAETKAIDAYWRLEDLEAHRRPMPPPEQNGFEQMMAAANALPAKPWPQPTFPQFDNDRPYQVRVVAAMTSGLRQNDRLSGLLPNQEEVRVLRSELERAKLAIALARKMVEFPTGRGPSIVPSQGTAGPIIPPYVKFLDVAKMLDPDARVRIYDADIAGACHDVRAVCQMGRFFEDDPSLMAQLVRHAVYEVALEMLERTLAGGSVSESELVALQHELEREAAAPMLYLGLQAERAVVDRMLEAVQSGAISTDEFRNQLYAGGPAVSGPLSTRIREAVRFVVLCCRLPSERAELLRKYNDLIKVAQLPKDERLLGIKEFVARDKLQSATKFSLTESPFQGQLMYAKYLENEVEPETHTSCAIVGLAAERFRLANQRWPQNLEELTPTFLKTVPLDPYSGKPLRLVRKGEAVIIYSIGPDEKDDGGSLERNKGAPGVDIGFVLHDPPQRRRPGKPFVYPQREERAMPR